MRMTAPSRHAWSSSTARVEGRALRGRKSTFAPQDVSRCQRRVATQIDFDRRGEPAQVERAVAAANKERGLGDVHLGRHRCIHAASAACGRVHARRVPRERTVGERVHLVDRLSHAGRIPPSVKPTGTIDAMPSLRYPDRAPRRRRHADRAARIVRRRLPERVARIRRGCRGGRPGIRASRELGGIQPDAHTASTDTATPGGEQAYWFRFVQGAGPDPGLEADPHLASRALAPLRDAFLDARTCASSTTWCRRWPRCVRLASGWRSSLTGIRGFPRCWTRSACHRGSRRSQCRTWRAWRSRPELFLRASHGSAEVPTRRAPCGGRARTGRNRARAAGSKACWWTAGDGCRRLTGRCEICRRSRSWPGGTPLALGRSLQDLALFRFERLAQIGFARQEDGIHDTVGADHDDGGRRDDLEVPPICMSLSTKGGT